MNLYVCVRMRVRPCVCVCLCVCANVSMDACLTLYIKAHTCRSTFDVHMSKRVHVHIQCIYTSVREMRSGVGIFASVWICAFGRAYIRVCDTRV